MLDKPATLPRARLSATPAEVLAVLPRIGRLMVTANHLGATHERIGQVQTVDYVDGWALLGGAEHESRIELAAIASIIIDRTSVMQQKAYPRLDLLRGDGTAICGIVGFDGLGPFDDATAPLGIGEAVEPKPERPAGERIDPGVEDPGLITLEAARQSGSRVLIGFRRPGFRQAYRGPVEAVKPAMGFINVMRPDFHLHLKAGAVKEWQRVDGEQRALAPDGTEIGLYLSQPEAAD